ncbi:DNA-binding transcriptional regulator, GntR family [Arthrobacter sp. yr096]|uniref:GntR family transcriptional regulator n=1 Tax=Arthrobacter sp. yr096 TaxID=1761750 RepID=UPI0008B30369|nr:GntR family transcriptional regulator [Arthrobacter sp. yr096]SEJ77999.1 DNA-binding transcriptional regulator, GntR family [Arthrobacter sp. yr096]
MSSRTEPSRRRPQLSDEASAYVRGLIISGELRPGTSVRPETIGEALNISTTPAREALQALRVEGFLDLVPRRGFLVAPLNGKDIRDLFLAQALIAGELAARAAANASAQDIDELQALHHELIAAASRNNHDLLEEKNHAFHRQINIMADSRKISWTLGLITRYVPRRFYSSIQGWPKATVEDHGELLECIKAKDSDATRAAMHEHIVHAGELLATHFDERVAAALTERPRAQVSV